MSQIDLERLTDPDPEVAAAAFERLWPEARVILMAFLRDRVSSTEEREDVICDTLNKVWIVRERFRPDGEKAWRQFLRTVAQNDLRDEVRKVLKRQEVPLENIGELREPDRPYMHVLLQDQEDRRRLYEYADAFWLGKATDETNRRFLAIQLYSDGVPKVAILRLLGAAALEEALTDPVVVARLAFDRLYYSNDRLAAAVLGISPEELDAVSTVANRGGEVPPPAGWTWSQVLVALHRVRNGLFFEQIARFMRHGLTPDEINDVIAKCRDRYPMAQEARRLLLDLPHPGPLAGDGLWKRLALQYFLVDMLPQRQILERLAPAAEVCGYKLTETTLAGWLSVGRLFTALAAYVEKQRCH